MKQLKAVAACGLFCMLTGGAIAAEKPLKTIPVGGDDAKERLASETRFSYTYAEARYVHTEFDDIDIGADGFGVSGSFLVIPNLFVVGAYHQAETDEFGGGATLKVTRFDLGAGYRFGLTQTVDLVGTLRAVQMDAEVPGFSDDGTGFQVAVGARALVTDQVEVAGNITYLDVDLDLFDDADTTLNVSGLYHIIPLLSAGVGLSYGDTYDEGGYSYGATVRFNF